jgi:hypothetical protein
MQHLDVLQPYSRQQMALLYLPLATEADASSHIVTLRSV